MLSVVTPSTPPPRKTVVFYDSPCIDGSTAAWVVHTHFKDNPDVALEFVPVKHDDGEKSKKILKALKTAKEAIFVDTSPDDNALFRLANPKTDDAKVDKLTVIDHHATEFERLRAFAERKTTYPHLRTIDLDLDRHAASASIMTWNHYHGDQSPPPFLESIGRLEHRSIGGTAKEQAMQAYIDNFHIPDLPHHGQAIYRVFKVLDVLAEANREDLIEGGWPMFKEKKKLQELLAEKLNKKVYYALIPISPEKQIWMPLVNVNIREPEVEHVLNAIAINTDSHIVGAWHENDDGQIHMNLRTPPAESYDKVKKAARKTPLPEYDAGEIAFYLNSIMEKEYAGKVPPAADNASVKPGSESDEHYVVSSGGGRTHLGGLHLMHKDPEVNRELFNRLFKRYPTKHIPAGEKSYVDSDAERKESQSKLPPLRQ